MAGKRSIYLINPKFQLKFAFFVSSLIFLSSLIYPLTIYEVFDTMMVHVTATSSALKLEDTRTQLIWTLIAYQIAFTAFVFIICIFQSHKIAGPIYKTQKHLNEISDGMMPTKVRFRTGDNFLELAESVNKAFDKINMDHDKDYAYLSEVISFINNLTTAVPEDKKAVIIEINSRLTEIQERFKGH